METLIELIFYLLTGKKFDHNKTPKAYPMQPTKREPGGMLPPYQRQVVKRNPRQEAKPGVFEFPSTSQTQNSVPYNTDSTSSPSMPAEWQGTYIEGQPASSVHSVNDSTRDGRTELEKELEEGRSMLEEQYEPNAAQMVLAPIEHKNSKLLNVELHGSTIPTSQEQARATSKRHSVKLAGTALDGMRWAIILGKPRSKDPHPTSAFSGYRMGKYR
ncbi:hypothetical protein ABE137_23320 [Brevibacillus laterosporus]|uniref:Uncharacterized protein n=1 Tax=Brevibacillus halotolerans TaxID=1507437 RepID=A0ABT4I3G4_9BACL|nr:MULTISPECIES: hypothetical protein [Brevibacillus]MCR8987864.1 hypothetical protein [Brevibacillus laterosporus]MCZ0833604.1 hypothetical protein [Brevibacillus halotolerans]